MSRSKTGSPKLGNIPKAFKHLQNRSQKMKLKESAKSIVANSENNGELRTISSKSPDFVTFLHQKFKE